MVKFKSEYEPIITIATPLQFKIVLYMRYNRTKLLNLVIIFWMVIRRKKLKGLSVLEIELF